jgi:hypothetical protein
MRTAAEDSQRPGLEATMTVDMLEELRVPAAEELIRLEGGIR